MKTSRFTDSQILSILKQAENGVPVTELCREHGMSSAVFYKWRAKYGGMDASLMLCMKELEKENRQLKKMYAESQMKAEVLQEALGKSAKTVSQAQDGQRSRERGKTEIRQACEAFRVSQACYRNQPKLSDENALIAEWLERLTANQRNRGFGLCFLYLRNVKGYGWNHTRV